MKHWEMRRRIAEFAGWTSIHESGRLDGQLVGYPPVPVIHDYKEIPDYVRDLNAMHEAEDHLTDKQKFEYHCNLGGSISDCGWTCDWSLTHAAAAQRVEALLKTIGKGEDS